MLYERFMCRKNAISIGQAAGTITYAPPIWCIDNDILFLPPEATRTLDLFYAYFEYCIGINVLKRWTSGCDISHFVNC